MSLIVHGIPVDSKCSRHSFVENAIVRSMNASSE
jgi:hypothetical protein